MRFQFEAKVNASALGACRLSAESNEKSSRSSIETSGLKTIKCHQKLCNQVKLISLVLCVVALTSGRAASEESSASRRLPAASQTNAGPSQLFLPAPKSSDASIVLVNGFNQRRPDEDEEGFLMQAATQTEATPVATTTTTSNENEPEPATTAATTQPAPEADQPIAIDTNRHQFLTHDQLSLSKGASQEATGEAQSRDNSQRAGASRSMPQRVGSLFSDVLAYAVRPRQAPAQAASSPAKQQISGAPQTSSTSPSPAMQPQPPAAIQSSPSACPGVCRNLLTVLSLPALCAEIPGQCGFMQRCCDSKADPFKGTPIEMSQPLEPEQTEAPAATTAPTSPMPTTTVTEAPETSTTNRESTDSGDATASEESGADDGPMPAERATQYTYILSSANGSNLVEDRGQTFDSSTELKLVTRPDQVSASTKEPPPSSDDAQSPRSQPTPVKLETANGPIVIQPPTRRPSYANWTDFSLASARKSTLAASMSAAGKDRVVYRSNMDQSRRFVETTNSTSSTEGSSSTTQRPAIQAKESRVNSQDKIMTGGDHPTTSTSTTTTTTTTTVSPPTTMTTVQSNEEESRVAPNLANMLVDILDNFVARTHEQATSEAPATTTLDSELETTTLVPADQQQAAHDVSSRQSDQQAAADEPIAAECAGQCWLSLFSNLCENRYKSHSCGPMHECCTTDTPGPIHGGHRLAETPKQVEPEQTLSECSGFCAPMHQSSLCVKPNLLQTSQRCPANYLCCQPASSERIEESSSVPVSMESASSSLFGSLLPGASGPTVNQQPLVSADPQSARDAAQLWQRQAVANAAADADHQANPRLPNAAKSSQNSLGNGFGIMNSLFNMFGKGAAKPRAPPKPQQAVMVPQMQVPMMVAQAEQPSYDQQSLYQMRLQQHQLAMQQQQYQQQQLQQQYQQQHQQIQQPVRANNPQIVYQVRQHAVAVSKPSPEFAQTMPLDSAPSHLNPNSASVGWQKQPAVASELLLTANSQPTANFHPGRHVSHQAPASQFELGGHNLQQAHSLPSRPSQQAQSVQQPVHNEILSMQQHQPQQQYHPQKIAMSQSQRPQFNVTPPKQQQQQATLAPSPSSYAIGTFAGGQVSAQSVHAQQPQLQTMASPAPFGVQQVPMQQQQPTKPASIVSAKLPATQQVRQPNTQEQRNPSPPIRPISNVNNKEAALANDRQQQLQQQQRPVRVQNQASLSDTQANDSAWRPQQIAKVGSLPQQQRPDSRRQPGIRNRPPNSSSGDNLQADAAEHRPGFVDIQRKEGQRLPQQQQQSESSGYRRPATLGANRAPDQLISNLDSKIANVWSPSMTQAFETRPNRVNYVQTTSTSTTTTTTTTTSTTTTTTPPPPQTTTALVIAELATDESSAEAGDQLEEQMTAKASSIQTATDTRTQSQEPDSSQPEVKLATEKPASSKPSGQACGLAGGGKRTRAQSGRVMGGFEAKPGHWCWQAALMTHKNEYLCGGALIGSKWVLTAAHCVTQQLKYESPLFVRLGQHNLNSSEASPGARSVQVRTSYVHHNHNGVSLDNDIALLRLNEPVDVDDPASPICLVCLPERHSQSLSSGKRCTVTGYGFETELGPAALRVRQTELPVVGDAECQAKTGQALEKPFSLPANSFCAGGELGRDSCHGDGGSPLSCLVDGYYELAGIVSWGYKCGKQDLPGVYSKVSSFVGWINQIVSANN